VKLVFGLVKNEEPENLEGSNLEDSCFSKTMFFVVDEQPFFYGRLLAVFFDQLPFQSLYKRLLCICKRCTAKKEINTPSYLCVDVGQIRPNHLKSLCS
jgi:hypothetical protein